MDILEEFSLVARRYTDFIDAQETPRIVDHDCLSILLAQLHSAVLELGRRPLPETSSEPEGPVDDGYSSHGLKYEQLGRQLAGLGFDYYQEVLNTHEITAPAEFGMGSLVDDLADIYLDLERGLTLFGSGCRLSAEWEWRFSYSAHWGRHLVSALSALHQWDRRTA